MSGYTSSGQGPAGRNWSRVTLGKQLAEFLAGANLNRQSTVGELVDAIKNAIVEEQGVMFVFENDFPPAPGVISAEIEL